MKKGDKGKIERIAKLAENLTAPVKAGQKIGEVNYIVSGNEIGKADLVAAGDVQKASFLKIFFTLVSEWFGLGRTMN